MDAQYDPIQQQPEFLYQHTQLPPGEGLREKTRRPVRNKRYNRQGRHFDGERRPPKRLFTPEIKKYLKDWLIRRRDNPYPNRDEKKLLAVRTGLTYIQVCNWFANWRRKLKNANGKERQRQTWGHLIKTYNSQVHGNVEHISICSEDSIWHEPEPTSGADLIDTSSTCMGINNTTSGSNCSSTETVQAQCFQVSSTTPEEQNTARAATLAPATNSKYKNHIMEKYLRDCQRPDNKPECYEQVSVEDKEAEHDKNVCNGGGIGNKPSMISKWLESAANFRPNEDNYLHWTLTNTEKRKCSVIMRKSTSNVKADCDAVLPKTCEQHGKEELDAAEALTFLANAHNIR